MFRIIPYASAPAVNLLDMFYDFDDLFKGEAAVKPFKTDIREENGVFMLDAELPGFDKDDIKIDIEDGRLILRAERKAESREKNNRYICRERSYGSFARSFNIEAVDEEKIEAEYKNGVLRLTLPKKSKEVPKIRRLEIN